jgi:hypothetical protein
VPNGRRTPREKPAFTLVTGNQLGPCWRTIFSSPSRNSAGCRKSRPWSIPSSPPGMQKMVAESYGAVCFDCLTGFNG